MWFSAVVGDGFIAKGITFENSAGPSKHQAVALRSGADLSAFYQCSFVAYQDTLYVHSLRQFYRECDVYGTVDFIFGNAAAVLQNCNLYARKPNPNQKNLFTAQGREDPNQNTGISIINCKVAAAADLIPVKSEFKNYLGRPWKKYSRTVYLNSLMEDLIDPAGWLEWNGTFALDTLYYGEYNNRGPGANTSRRVTWPGYRVITNSTEASQFTVANFIQGNEWLTSLGIPFFSGLSWMPACSYSIKDMFFLFLLSAANKVKRSKCSVYRRLCTFFCIIYGIYENIRVSNIIMQAWCYKFGKNWYFLKQDMNNG